VTTLIVGTPGFISGLLLLAGLAIVVIIVAAAIKYLRKK
jgi:hypothetical protein